jgi:hypothetical protein
MNIDQDRLQEFLGTFAATAGFLLDTVCIRQPSTQGDLTGHRYPSDLQ